MASYVEADDESATRATHHPHPRVVAPRRPRMRERVSLGHLFMVAAGLLAFILVVSILQDRDLTTGILVADAEILPGDRLTPDLVTEIQVPADSDLVGQVATQADLAGGDLSAGHRLVPGDPITLSALAPAATPSGLRAMAVPIDRIHAVGGDLAPGDRVDVISVMGGTASYIALDLEVIDTQAADGRTGALSGSALSTYYVTVSVDDQTALALALALDAGAVSVLRSTGAEPVAGDDRHLDTVELSPRPTPTGRGTDQDGEGGP